MKMLHIAGKEIIEHVYPHLFISALEELGELTLVENGKDIAEDERAALIRQHQVLLTSWSVPPVPMALADDPGELRYVCNVTGELSQWVPLEIVEAGIPVTNWGDTPAISVAEGAMTLLLAVLKDLHTQTQAIRQGAWALGRESCGGSLYRLAVGIYGCGVIARRFIDLLRPFGATIRVFDPFVATIPEGCERVDSLEALFGSSQASVVHCGLTDDTRGTVTRDLLALLPDHGVVINTARGAIIDQDALFDELRSGRLRAGLDVTVPEPLPVSHEARSWPNCILTAHSIARGWPGNGSDTLAPMHDVCLDNLRRFKHGEPLRFTYDRDRWLRSS